MMGKTEVRGAGRRAVLVCSYRQGPVTVTAALLTLKMTSSPQVHTAFLANTATGANRGSECAQHRTTPYHSVLFNYRKLPQRTV